MGDRFSFRDDQGAFLDALLAARSKFGYFILALVGDGELREVIRVMLQGS